MGKVIKFYPANAADNPDAVLEQASGAYNSVLVIGWGKDDVLDARASTNLTGAEILWLMEFFKMKLVRGDYSDGV